MSTEDLIAKLEVAISADEQWAVAASTSWDAITATGEHWHWECSHCDTDIEIEPLDEMMRCPRCGSYGVGLRSVEEYDSRSVGMLAHLALQGTEEVSPTVAGHIIRHDPARVLHDVAAHREILKWAKEAISMCTVSPGGVLSQPGEHMMGDIGRWNVEALAKAYGVDEEAQT